MKHIPETERNPIFLLPLDERMRKVDEILLRLQNNTPDIRFFDIKPDVIEDEEECRNNGR